jgi:hypothetical protein
MPIPNSIDLIAANYNPTKLALNFTLRKVLFEMLKSLSSPGGRRISSVVDDLKNNFFEMMTFHPAQWENISITSIEVDFWRVKSSGCENSHATEVKCSNIPQKS